jgi:hypothetical protein
VTTRTGREIAIVARSLRAYSATNDSPTIRLQSGEIYFEDLSARDVS